ncbi:MAG TPA: TlpA disulfide reductase family protein [Streptosporangiaceae bacterium]|nr:TlpA disulfide reductase family protein [Streptosporangiaceae bacterium]
MIPRARSPRAVPVSAAIAVAGSLAAAGLLAGCAGTEAARTGPGAGDSRYVAGDGSSRVIEPADRKPAPRVRGTTLDGEPFDLAALRGKVVVVNFWASWCAPCRGEAPALEQVYREHKSRGVEFAGVDIKDDREPARAFVRKFKVGYPSIVDPDGQVTLAFRDVPPNAVPSTLILDRQGRIAARVIGATTYDRLTRLLGQVIGA